MCAAQPCCFLPQGRQARSAPQALFPNASVSLHAHQQGRHTKSAVVSLGFGHGVSLPPFPRHLAVRPQLLFPTHRDGEQLLLQLAKSTSPLQHCFYVCTSLQRSVLSSRRKVYRYVRNLLPRAYADLEQFSSDSQSQVSAQQTPAGTSQGCHPHTSHGGLLRAFGFTFLFGFIIEPK